MQAVVAPAAPVVEAAPETAQVDYCVDPEITKKVRITRRTKICGSE